LIAIALPAALSFGYRFLPEKEFGARGAKAIAAVCAPTRDVDMPGATTNVANSQPPARPADLLDLFWVFVRIGLTAFGGSTQAWAFRDIVERRRWLSERQFVAGYAVAQVLPGSNPLNIALFVGLQLRGGAGAAAAACGMVLPAFGVVLLMGYLYRQFGGIAAAHVLLGGVAAVGIGATASVGVKLAARLSSRIRRWVIAAGTFAAVGLLHWPLIAVVSVVVPLSIVLSFFFDRRSSRAG
jgi:chromate transporter